MGFAERAWRKNGKVVAGGNFGLLMEAAAKMSDEEARSLMARIDWEEPVSSVMRWTEGGSTRGMVSTERPLKILMSTRDERLTGFALDAGATKRRTWISSGFDRGFENPETAALMDAARFGLREATRRLIAETSLETLTRAMSLDCGSSNVFQALAEGRVSEAFTEEATMLLWERRRVLMTSGAKGRRLSEITGFMKEQEIEAARYMLDRGAEEGAAGVCEAALKLGAFPSEATLRGTLRGYDLSLLDRMLRLAESDKERYAVETREENESRKVIEERPPARAIGSALGLVVARDAARGEASRREGREEDENFEWKATKEALPEVGSFFSGLARRWREDGDEENRLGLILALRKVGAMLGKEWEREMRSGRPVPEEAAEQALRGNEKKLAERLSRAKDWTRKECEAFQRELLAGKEERDVWRPSQEDREKASERVKKAALMTIRLAHWLLPEGASGFADKMGLTGAERAEFEAEDLSGGQERKEEAAARPRRKI